MIIFYDENVRDCDLTDELSIVRFYSLTLSNRSGGIYYAVLEVKYNSLVGTTL